MKPSARAAPSDQEAAFVDFVERIGKLKDGRRALYIHISKLRPQNRQEHHLRIVAMTFEPLINAFEGTLFRLHNNDLVVFTKGASEDDMDREVARLRYLFSGDPPVKSSSVKGAPFCDRYDIESDYGVLLSLAKRMLRARQCAPAHGAASEAASGHGALKPLDPSNLGTIQNAISQADLSGMIRRQPVCVLAPGQEPQTVFHEIFTSIETLRRTLLPDMDIFANRWLFQDLTQHLDRRVISHLGRNDDGMLDKAFSVNLNIATLLSPEFLKFDKALSSAVRRTIVIELQLIDVFANLESFLFVRNFLSDRGYRFCLDSLNHVSLPLIDRNRLGFDLVKLIWSAELHEIIDGDNDNILRDAAAGVGPGRLILIHCDSELALKTGQMLGTVLFQGYFIDQLLNKGPARARAGQPAAKTAAAHAGSPRG